MKSFFQRLHDSQAGTSKSRTKDALYRPWAPSKQDKDLSKPTENAETTSKYQTVKAKSSQPAASPYIDTLGRATTDRTTRFSTLPGPSNSRRAHKDPSMVPFQQSDPSTSQTRPLKPPDKPPITSAISTKRGDLTEHSGNEKEDTNRGQPSRSSRSRQPSNSAVPPQHQVWLPPDAQRPSSEKSRKKERKRAEEGNDTSNLREEHTKGYALPDRLAPGPPINEGGDIKGVDQKGKDISEEAQCDRPKVKQPSMRERLEGKDQDARNYSQIREQEWRERERVKQERREREREKDARRQQREDESKRKEQQVKEAQEKYQEDQVKEQREQERKERRERQDREKREREFQEEHIRREIQEREYKERERRHRERIERKRREEDERLQRDLLRKETEQREKQQQLKEQRDADKMAKDLLQRNLERDPIQVDFLHTQRKRQEERKMDRELWEQNLERMREERRNESSRNENNSRPLATRYNDKPTLRTRTKDRIDGAIESDKDQGKTQDFDGWHPSQDVPLYPRAQDQMNRELESQHQRRGQSTKPDAFLSETLGPVNKLPENMRRTPAAQAPIIPSTQPQRFQSVTSTSSPQEARPTPPREAPYLPSEGRPDIPTARAFTSSTTIRILPTETLESDGRTQRSVMYSGEQPQLLMTGSQSSVNTQPQPIMVTGVQDTIQVPASANSAPSSSTMRVASQPQHKVPQDSRHHLSEHSLYGDPHAPDTRRHPPEILSTNAHDLALTQNVSLSQTTEIYSTANLTPAAVSDPHLRGQPKRNDLPSVAGNSMRGVDSSRRREMNYSSGTVAAQRGYPVPEIERPSATLVADARTDVGPLAQEQDKYSPAFLPPSLHGRDISAPRASPGRAGNELQEETISNAPALQTPPHTQSRPSPRTNTHKLTGPISNTPSTSQNTPILPGLSEPAHMTEAKHDNKDSHEKPILDSPYSNQSKEVPRHHRQHSEPATLRPGTNNSPQFQTADSKFQTTESSQARPQLGQIQQITTPLITKKADTVPTQKMENLPSDKQHTPPQHSRGQSADIFNTQPQQYPRAHVSNLVSRYENTDEVVRNGSGSSVTRPHTAIGQSSVKAIIPAREPNNGFHTDPRNHQHQSHPQIERPPSASASRPTHDRAQASQAIEIKALGNNRVDILPGKPSRTATFNSQLNNSAFQNDTEKRTTYAEIGSRDIQEKPIQVSGVPAASSSSIPRTHASAIPKPATADFGTRNPERKESNEVRLVPAPPPPLSESNNRQDTDDKSRHLTTQHSPITSFTVAQVQDQPRRKQDYGSDNSPVYLRSTPSKYMNAGTEGADSERRSGMPRTEPQRQLVPSEVAYLVPPSSQRPPVETYTTSPAQISPSGGSSSPGTRRHKNVQGSSSPNTQQRSPNISTDKESISPQRTGGSAHTRSEEESQPHTRIKHERLAELLSSSPLRDSDAPHQSHLQDARRTLASKLEQQVEEPARGSPGSHTNTVESVGRSRGVAPGDHSPRSIRGDPNPSGTSIPSNQEREPYSRDRHYTAVSTTVPQQASASAPDAKPTESHPSFGLPPSGRQQPDEVVLAPVRSSSTHHLTSIRAREKVQTTTSDIKDDRRSNHTVPTVTTTVELKARADDTHRIAHIPTTTTLYPIRDTHTPSSHKNGHGRQPSDAYVTEPVPLPPNRTRSYSQGQEASTSYPRQPSHQQGSHDIPLARTTSVPAAPYTIDPIQPSRSRSAHPHQLTERETASIPNPNAQTPLRSTPSQSTYTTTLPPETRSANSVPQPTTPKSYEIWLPTAVPQDDQRTQPSIHRERDRERERDRAHRDRDQDRVRERRRERDRSDRRDSGMPHMRASSPTRRAPASTARRVPVPPPNADPHIFSPFHYLKSRKISTMSIVSMQAQDGAASTVIGSPTSSMLSTAPIHIPPVQDPIVAAREWSKTNALIPGKRIRRPGLVWEDPEDPPLHVAEQRRLDRSRTHRKSRSTGSRSREGSDSEPALSS